MGFPLTDITIYYNDNVIKKKSDWVHFNYIADYYHNNLDGYKPPKAGRICIRFEEIKYKTKPSFFGAICQYESVFDEKKYLRLSRLEKPKYILEVLHSTIMEIADFFNWDKTIFQNSYDKIVSSNYKFKKLYPSKLSKDGKHKAQVSLEKSVNKATIYILLETEKKIRRIKLYEKTNHFWYDSTYEMVKYCKWIDNQTFGINSTNKKVQVYYSLLENSITNNFALNKLQH